MPWVRVLLALTLHPVATAVTLSRHLTSPRQHNQTQSLASSPNPGAFWSCKNGDFQRTGASGNVGPIDLSKPSWTFEDPVGYGAIESSPVIDGSYNSYITTTAGGVFAIRRDGTVFWSQRLPGRVMTPALVGDVLFVATSAARAYAFNATTGQSLWEKRVDETAGTDAWTLTLAADVLLVPSGRSEGGNNNVIRALKTTDGTEVWAMKLRNSIYNFMPVVVGETFLFMDSSGGVARADARNGNLLWYSQPAEKSFATGGIVLGPSGLIYATSNTNSGSGLVHAHNIIDGRQVWERSFDTEAAAAPAVLRLGKGSIVVGLGFNCMSRQGLSHSGSLVALDAQTGQENWSFTPPVYYGFMAKGVERGFLGTAGSEHIEAISLPDTWTNPAVGADGTVYSGWHGGVLYALDGKTGRMRSSYNVGYSFQGEPAIAPGYLVAPSIYRVVAFDDVTQTQERK